MPQTAQLVFVGDPTIIGWATVLIYFAAVARCLIKASASKKFGGNYQFWLNLATLLLFLSVNKQLDLQTWFEQTMKALAEEHGWYAQRALLQKIFIMLLGLGMLAILISFRLYLANTWRNYRLTLLGLMLLCLFILIRAASFNRLDFLIDQDIMGLKISEMLEISAISLIILGTFLHKKQIGFVKTDALTVKDYVEIEHENSILQCPQCGIQPLSKAVNGRLYKCRSCGFKYTLIIPN